MNAGDRLTGLCLIPLIEFHFYDLQNGFGFFHAKPPTSFAPIVATPESLGTAWRDNRLHLPVRIEQRRGDEVKMAFILESVKGLP